MKSAFAGMFALALMATPAAYADDKIAAATGSGQVDGQETAQQKPEDAGAIAKLGSVAETSTTMSLAVALAKDIARPPLPAPITLTLKVDLASQRVTVMEGSTVKYVWPISSGKSGYATQAGTFKPQWTSKMWYSRQWDMAPMPHAVFFNGGTAFHATSATGMLGQPASHGCVRLAPGNAAKLYSLVHRHGLQSTKVVVQGSGKEPAIARRKQQDRQAMAGRDGYYQPAYAYGGGYQTKPSSQRGNRKPSPSMWGF